MGRALVLNATYEPLCVVPVRRAVILVLKEKAEVLQHRDEELHSERMSLPVPSVIRLVHFVRVPFRARAPFLPLPDPDYVRFRLQTAYGPHGSPAGDDLVAYLNWCREFKT